jgi:hypothetical protein
MDTSSWMRSNNCLLIQQDFGTKSLSTPLLGPFTPGPGETRSNATKASKTSIPSCPLYRATCYVQDITAGDGSCGGGRTSYVS